MGASSKYERNHSKIRQLGGGVARRARRDAACPADQDSEPREIPGDFQVERYSEGQKAISKKSKPDNRAGNWREGGREASEAYSVGACRQEEV